MKTQSLANIDELDEGTDDSEYEHDPEIDTYEARGYSSGISWPKGKTLEQTMKLRDSTLWRGLRDVDDEVKDLARGVRSLSRRVDETRGRGLVAAIVGLGFIGYVLLTRNKDAAPSPTEKS